MSQKSPHRTRGYSAAVLSAAALSTTAIFIRYLTQTYAVPPLVLAFWRNVFLCATLAPVLRLFWPHMLSGIRPHLRFIAGYGLLLAIFNALWTLSVAWNGAAVATVLVYSSTAFTALLGRWLLGEQLTWARLVAIAACLGGCVLVAGALDASAWQTNLPGIITGILAGLAYASYSLLGRSASLRGLNPWTTLLYTFAAAGVFLLVANLFFGGLLPGAAPAPADLLWFGSALAGWAILWLLAAGPTVGGFGLYNVALSLLPSGIVNLIATLEPVFTSVTAYLLLGERLTGVQIAGSLLITGSVVLLRLREK